MWCAPTPRAPRSCRSAPTTSSTSPRPQGSPHVPAQDFVEAHGIRSALGFGGMLYTGDFYAVVLFSKTPIASDTAQLLKIFSLAVRVPMLAHLRRVFSE